jgi:predicted O-methyltransferase YrrM
MVTYIHSLESPECEIIETIEQEALENFVPIIRKETQSFLKVLLMMKKPLHILEVGTAVGYSSLCFSMNDSVELIDTIERNPNMYQEAINNIQECCKEKVIKVHYGDALEVEISKFSSDYDLLFIDAAKAQSRKFFERFSPLLKPDGIIIVDNILFHGVSVEDENISRNLRQLVRKICLILTLLIFPAVIYT